MALIGEAKRAYQLAWIKCRRQNWIDENGPCASCGSTDNLEVDHKNPKEKRYSTSALWGMSLNNPNRIKELAKCQVLCFTCHKAKTLADGNTTTLKKLCRMGHELTQDNIYVHPSSKRRECARCRNNRSRWRTISHPLS